MCPITETMKLRKLIILPVILIFLYGCPQPNNDFKYQVILTDNPANLDQLNSMFDDYNIDLPYPAQRLDIYFSSNRNSNGYDFDINAQCMDISFHEEDNILNLHIANDYPHYSYELLPLINTDKNEYGPYSFTTKNSKFVFMYATEENDVFNIKYVYTYTSDWGHYDSEQTTYGPYNVAILNSDKNDYYPTFNSNSDAVYFCSDRDDKSFNIYKVQIPSVNDVTSVFENTGEVVIAKDTILSSLYDDKCPSINNNLLVFTSNREGGYGGFDLWYSQLVENSWTTPVNFGSKINSEYDEYRPVTFRFLDYDLMIFSSNRPGGKGGFDLYCVKIEDLIE